ncbi:hypothetical protein Tco_0207486, partial [Tanacetum coccineum]
TDYPADGGDDDDDDDESSDDDEDDDDDDVEDVSPKIWWLIRNYIYHL